MTKMPRFDYTWNIGHVLTIFTFLVSALAVYVQLNNQITTLVESNSQLKLQIGDLQDEKRMLENRVRAVEVAQSRIDEKLIAISATLQEIKITLQEKLRNE